LVLVTPREGVQIDVEKHLDGLAEDLASYALDDFALVDQRVVRRKMNWKLVSDTFWEAYHIKVLHKSNVAPLFVKNLALYDGFGLCHRLSGFATRSRRCARCRKRNGNLLRTRLS